MTAVGPGGFSMPSLATGHIRERNGHFQVEWPSKRHGVIRRTYTTKAEAQGFLDGLVIMERRYEEPATGDRCSDCGYPLPASDRSEASRQAWVTVYSNL
jgi:hypothetical protein